MVTLLKARYVWFGYHTGTVRPVHGNLFPKKSRMSVNQVAPGAQIDFVSPCSVCKPSRKLQDISCVMFAFPSKESPTSLSSVSQKVQFPAKPKPQSPYGLHRFSYTNEHNVAQTALVRTPSPNKDFRKVSSQHNVLESPAQSTDNTQQTRPRAMSAGSVRSAKTVNTQNTTETAQTNNSLNTNNSRLSTGISVANSVSEGAVNRDLGKWFQTSTKDPKIAFMQSSLISVLKTTSRSSTPTRSLASNSSFMSVNNKSSASVLSTGERRLPLSTPHASSAWREHYQERGKERVEEFMQVDHLDYLGLAELAATSISRNQTEQQSGQVDGDDRSTVGDNDYKESGQLTLDQQRSLKDAQDGLMSLQAMGDAVLGASRVQSNINSGGGGGGGLSPQSLLGLGKHSIFNDVYKFIANFLSLYLFIL